MLFGIFLRSFKKDGIKLHFGIQGDREMNKKAPVFRVQQHRQKIVLLSNCTVLTLVLINRELN